MLLLLMAWLLLLMSWILVCKPSLLIAGQSKSLELDRTRRWSQTEMGPIGDHQEGGHYPHHHHAGHPRPLPLRPEFSPGTLQGCWTRTENQEMSHDDLYDMTTHGQYQNLSNQ